MAGVLEFTDEVTDHPAMFALFTRETRYPDCMCVLAVHDEKNEQIYKDWSTTH